MFRVSVMWIVVFLVLVTSPTTALAAPIKVTVNTDFDTVDSLPGDRICADSNGQCSLRAAVMEANELAAGSVIRLPPGTYVLTRSGPHDDNAETGDIDVKQSMTIIGSGANRTTINGNELDRIFHGQNVQFSLRDVTITGGFTHPDSPDGGGLLQVGGTLSINRVVFLGNQTFPGGSGGAVMIGVPTTNNVTTNAHIKNTSFIENLADNGGGLYISGANLDPVTSTISNSTFYNNDAGFAGGGLYLEDNHDIFMTGTTVAFNFSANQAGGMYFLFGSSAVRAVRTLITGNVASINYPDCRGEFYGGSSGNVISNTTGCTYPTGSFTVDNTQLFPPATFGITTTPVLMFGGNDSVAVNGGGHCQTPDQLGIPRLPGQLCDVGAVEVLDANGVLENITFETPSALQPLLPDHWKAAGIKKDKLICNTASPTPGQLDKIVAFEGSCAMRFIGAAGKTTSLTQAFSPTSILNIDESDALYIIFYASGSKIPKNTAFVTVTLKYLDGGTQRIRVNAAAGTYDYRQFVALIPLNGFVTGANVRITYSGATGTFTVDNMNVLLTNTPVLRHKWIPLATP